MDTLRELLQTVLDGIAAAPAGLILVALVLLPLVGVPVSPLWIALGIRFGAGWGILMAMAGLLVNFTLGYLIAAHLGHGRMRTWLERRGRSVPALARGEELRWIALVRVTPGVPLFVQNYVLGLAKVHFPSYLLVSLPIQSLYAALFVVLGTSLQGSRLWYGVLAGAGLVAAGLVISLLRSRLQRRGAGGDPTA
ncbi:MAG: VTT domain-containing protein [Verrucomicrobiales bacterium]|nr:VTT domain-containing protein [Verrucomicrobiales bacterium]